MTWRLLQDEAVGAAEGLATDDILARRVGEDRSPPTLRLYTYRPHAVLVGRFQDVEREVHVRAALDLGLELNRRPTGGGAILMGPDQLGVALAVPGRNRPGEPAGLGRTERARERMARFSDGLRRALASLGIEAAFRGKNDLEVNGRKIAGLGIHRAATGGLLFHASLLLDLDVALMARVLRTPFVSTTDAELAVVARRTTTVRELANESVSLADVRTQLARGFAASFGVVLEPGTLDSDEREEVAALVLEQYATRNWLFQRTEVCDSTGTASIKTSGGRLDVSVALAGRMIKAVNVRGDFIESEGALADLEGRLRWTSSEESAVVSTVRQWASIHSTGTVAADPLARAIVFAVGRARVEASGPAAGDGPAPYGCFVTPEECEAARMTELLEAESMRIRRANFPDRIRFHAPGLQRYSTSEYTSHDATEFVSISVTGNSCALSCDHCEMQVLRGMSDLTAFDGSLYELCARLAERGARGVLISGGSDTRGRVPLLQHVPDLVRVRRELGLLIRVHPGLPDEATCAGLGEVGIDGAMIDVIGHEDTIRDVYHLDARPEDYDDVLRRLEQHAVPTVPHIILGLHFGRMLGEERALEIVAAHPPRLLVLVVLMQLGGTAMADVTPPPLEEIGAFFKAARAALPAVPVMLGCARPLGELKLKIDRLAIDAGLNGVAYPADGIVAYAENKGLEPTFVDACCGVTF